MLSEIFKAERKPTKKSKKKIEKKVEKEVVTEEEESVKSDENLVETPKVAYSPAKDETVKRHPNLKFPKGVRRGS